MSSSVFRQIALADNADERAEGLFRAAISAYCSLPRPSRQDASRLDTLAVPLLDKVPAAARRFASAALSECETAPRDLVRRLASDAIDVAAPLLVRSPAISDVDLLTLIGRHGQAHATAIGRRRELNPIIAGLVRAIGEPAAPAQAAARPEPAAEARDRLRTMMRPAPAGRRAVFLRLRDSALADKPALLATALADALGIWFDRAERIVAHRDLAEFGLALRAVGLRSEEAFVLAAMVAPHAFGDLARIVNFIRAFESISAQQVSTALNRWREDGAAAGRVTA
ncbi:MAG: hypothetical protein INR68_04405 [Methylobacterium mesophilicum]|nr:hypothetical protein [Methylobacterium mesophilicum]